MKNPAVLKEVQGFFDVVGQSQGAAPTNRLPVGGVAYLPPRPGSTLLAAHRLTNAKES